MDDDWMRLSVGRCLLGSDGPTVSSHIGQSISTIKVASHRLNIASAIQGCHFAPIDTITSTIAIAVAIAVVITVIVVVVVIVVAYSHYSL